eukprot:SAG31_NODE_4419_length_3250_cov_2.345922_1_plen_252_part_00
MQDKNAFVYQSTAIKAAVLKFPESKSNALTALSISIFNNVLGYTGASIQQYPHMLAKETLEKGLETPELRDEIYLQIIKQTRGAKDEILLRAWQLLFLCCKTFPPSEDLFPYVRVYIYQGKMGQLRDLPGAARVQAETCLPRLEKIVQKGPAESTPTLESIEALRNREEVQVKVYFLDNSMKRYPITEETTVKELLATIGRDLKYEQMDTCGLYDIKDFAHPTLLKADLRVADIMMSWQVHIAKLLQLECM